MRRLLAIGTAIGLAVSPVCAEPLKAGKPAGVQHAQLGGGPEVFVLGGIAIGLAAVLIATSGGRSSPANNQIPAVSSTV
jgi:hypothetical protein